MASKQRGVRDRDSTGFGPAEPGGSPGSTTLWVDNNRTDLYLEVGTAERPFKSAAAAFVAALALAAGGIARAAVILAPGQYLEDIDFQPPGTFEIEVQGYGRSGAARLRSLRITPPAAGSLRAVVHDLNLGGTGGSTRPAFIVDDDGAAGTAFIAVQNCNLQLSTDGLPAVMDVPDNGGAGAISMRFDNLQISTPGISTPTVGLRQARGLSFGFGEIGGFDAPAVALAGTATTALDRIVLIVDTGAGPADVDAVTHAGAGAVTLTNARIEPKGAGDAIGHLGAGLITIAQAAIVTGTGAGGVSSAGGVVVVASAVNLALGAAIPLPIAGALAVVPAAQAIQLGSLLAGGVPAAGGLALVADGAGNSSYAGAIAAAPLTATRTGGAVFSTTAVGFVLVPGLSLVPAAGTYLAMIAAEVTNDTAGREVNTALRVAGVTVAERVGFRVDDAGAYQSVSLLGVVVVTGVETVNAAISRDAGVVATSSIRDGEIILLRVA